MRDNATPTCAKISPSMLLHFPLTSFYCVLLKELLEESVEAELQVINSFINSFPRHVVFATSPSPLF